MVFIDASVRPAAGGGRAPAAQVPRTRASWSARLGLTLRAARELCWRRAPLGCRPALGAPGISSGEISSPLARHPVISSHVRAVLVGGRGSSSIESPTSAGRLQPLNSAPEEQGSTALFARAAALVWCRALSST